MAHEERGLFGLEGRALLVLETDAECAAAVSRWLEICGARVATAATLGAAVTQARRQAPELVLVDVSLPDGDDWEIVERLRENVPGGSHVPVVAVTGRHGSANSRTARAHGVREVVERPIAPAALGAALSACLRTRGASGVHRPVERRMRGRRRLDSPLTRRTSRVISGCGPVTR
jgi:CheY-like chemotaxis protein